MLVARAIKDTQLTPRRSSEGLHGLSTPALEFHVVVTTADKDQFDHVDG